MYFHELQALHSKGHYNLVILILVKLIPLKQRGLANSDSVRGNVLQNYNNFHINDYCHIQNQESEPQKSHDVLPFSYKWKNRQQEVPLLCKGHKMREYIKLQIRTVFES